MYLVATGSFCVYAQNAAVWLIHGSKAAAASILKVITLSLKKKTFLFLIVSLVFYSYGNLIFVQAISCLSVAGQCLVPGAITADRWLTAIDTTFESVFSTKKVIILMILS